MLIYLKDTPEGGETAFPSDSKWVDPEMPQRFGPFSECARSHVAVRPKKGDALLFHSINPDGSQDDHSLHTGCPGWLEVLCAWCSILLAALLRHGALHTSGCVSILSLSARLVAPCWPPVFHFGDRPFFYICVSLHGRTQP